MGYKIEQIEGIGAAYAEKLNAAGIKTTEDLLEKCASRKGRLAIAEETGISAKLILKWTNHADLFRINGIAGQFAELLEAAGVDTVKEFRHRVPANLQPKLEAVNAEKNLCNRVPSVTELEKMIAQTKELQPLITY
jgi:predicted flap endonuclease-1-like 5' DNA nuclease